MKKKVQIGKLAVFLIALLCVVSCDDDDDPKWNSTSDPVLILTSEAVQSSPGKTFVITGTVVDELGIKSIKLSNDEWYLDKTIDVYKGDSLTTNYNLSYEFIMPENAVDKENVISIAVTNVGNREITSSVSVYISDIYQKMYLADVATDAELVSDLFGVPMLIDSIGENIFEAKYYASTANTEVKFIPQTTSFSPHCYGIDPSNESNLIDSQEALPIILAEVGYYKININLNSLTYSVEKYTPDDEVYTSYTDTDDDNEYVGELGIVGKGFPEYPNQSWSVPDAIIFDRDADNLYLFTKTLDLEGTVEIVLTPEHKSGWWLSPSWHFDRAIDPEKTVQSSSINVNMEVPIRTTYTLIFDSHLNRMRAVKVD